MALPTASKVLVGVLGLSALLFIMAFALVLSPVLAGACAVALVVSLVALVIRLRQQRPLRGWLILAGVSLVLSILFSSVASALYGSSDNSGKEASVSPEPTEEATQEPTQEATQEPTQEATQEPTVQKRKAAKPVAETTTPATPLREPNEPTTPDYLKKEYTNPQTPEETVLASIERESGMPLSKHQDIQAAVDTDQNGCRNIQLNYQTTDPTSIESEMEGFYKAIYGDRQYGNTVCSVTITAYETLSDSYGQRTLEEAYQTTLGRNQASRINWNNSGQVDFANLWTVNYVHPSVEAEIARSNLEHAVDCLDHNVLFDFDWLQCP